MDRRQLPDGSIQCRWSRSRWRPWDRPLAPGRSPCRSTAWTWASRTMGERWAQAGAFRPGQHQQLAWVWHVLARSWGDEQLNGLSQSLCLACPKAFLRTGVLGDCSLCKNRSRTDIGDTWACSTSTLVHIPSHTLYKAASVKDPRAYSQLELSLMPVKH